MFPWKDPFREEFSWLAISPGLAPPLPPPLRFIGSEADGIPIAGRFCAEEFFSMLILPYLGPSRQFKRRIHDENWYTRIHAELVDAE